MRITLLNGNPQSDNLAFEDYTCGLTQALVENGAQVTSLVLRDMDIRYCVGCWGCWVKTPGECLSKDDSADVCRAVIDSDLTVMASPLKMGFPSALLKKTVDKLIPLVHPYSTLVQGEVHHVARYPRYPRLALLLQPESDTDSEDIAIVTEIFGRSALNLKSSLAFTLLTTQAFEEGVDAVNCL